MLTFVYLCVCLLLSLCAMYSHRSANLILNLFSLMLDAGVPDIALEPDKTVQKVCNIFFLSVKREWIVIKGWFVCVYVKVEDKFCPNFNEEQAVLQLQNLIDVSVTAVMAVFVERMHKWAQYWRK